MVNSEIISLLLASGDEFKKRISQLQKGDTAEWDTTELSSRLKEAVAVLNGEIPPSMSEVNETSAVAASVAAAAQDPVIIEPAATAAPIVAEDDHTNYELLKELEAEMAALSPSSAPVELTPPTPLAVTHEPALQKPIAQEGSLVKSNKPALSFSIKVDSTRVDSVLDSVGELVVLKNRIHRLLS